MRLSRFRPRLRTIFVLVNLVILGLPLGGVVLLRLYESALIRRTETALIAQGAVVAAACREEVRRERRAHGLAVAPRELDPAPADDDAALGPREARLNLAVDRIYPRPVDGRPDPTGADPLAAAAGARLSPVLRDAQRFTLAGIRVTDAHGVVIASTRGELGRSIAHRIEVRRALAGEAVSLLRERVSDDPPPPLDSLSRTTRLRVFVALPVRDGDRIEGAVVVSRTPMSVAQALYGIRWHIAAGAAALLAAVIIVSAFTSRTVTRPVDQLIAQTERVAAGDREAMTPLARPGTHEVARLSTAFVSMARVLEQRTAYVTAFAAAVSHEFKTPLTAIRGTIELLRDHLGEMTASERDRFLANLDADAERLQRLVGRLLELARAEVVKPRGETCAVTPLMVASAERARAAGHDVQISTRDDRAQARIAGEALQSILTSLIENACCHGGADVRVRLACRRDRDEIVIEVADDGPGISPANARRVFDPFFTTARDAGGTGLGLSIARSLVRAHDGSVHLHSAPGATVFSVRLPAEPA